MAPHDVTNGSNGHTNGHASTNTTQTSKPTTDSSSSSSTSAPADYTLADRLAVHRSPKDFGSYAYSLIDLPAGALFTPITGISHHATKAYSSVQTGPDAHIELNSDLVFCNQSCAPSLEFDMAAMEVRVARDRALRKGDALTFWYPSTEWAMAQPFTCECGSGECKGVISGAGQMSEEVVRGYWLNEHIEKMLDERAQQAKQ